MALVRAFETISKDRHSVHDEVSCGYCSFRSKRGQRFIQFDTYGSETRRLQGKVSQSLQLDEQGARELLQILEEFLQNSGD